MLKSLMEFLATGAIVIVGYFVYLVTAFMITVIIGLPIAVGIKTLIDVVNILFGGVSNANI